MTLHWTPTRANGRRPTMTKLHPARSTMIQRIAVAAFAGLVAGSACGWSTLQRDVIRPVEGFPGTFDAWVYDSYAIVRRLLAATGLLCEQPVVSRLRELQRSHGRDDPADTDGSEWRPHRRRGLRGDLVQAVGRRGVKRGCLRASAEPLYVRDDDDRPSHDLRRRPVDPSQPAPGGTDRARPTR